MPPKKTAAAQKRKLIVRTEDSSSDGESDQSKRVTRSKAAPKQTARCTGRGGRSASRGRGRAVDHRSRSRHRRDSSVTLSSGSENDGGSKAQPRRTKASSGFGTVGDLADVVKLMNNPALKAMAALLVESRNKNDAGNSFKQAAVTIKDFDVATDVDEWADHFFKSQTASIMNRKCDCSGLRYPRSASPGTMTSEQTSKTPMPGPSMTGFGN